MGLAYYANGQPVRMAELQSLGGIVVVIRERGGMVVGGMRLG